LCPQPAARSARAARYPADQNGRYMMQTSFRVELQRVAARVKELAVM
jgi:hypothetical protein